MTGWIHPPPPFPCPALLPRSGAPAVHGSLVPFALLPSPVGGGAMSPVVAIRGSGGAGDKHLANLRENPRASLTLGATDPPEVK